MRSICRTRSRLKPSSVPYLGECAHLSIGDAVAQHEDLGLATGKLGEDPPQQCLTLHRDGGCLGRWRIRVLDQVAKGRLLVVADQPVETDERPGGFVELPHPVERDVQPRATSSWVGSIPVRVIRSRRTRPRRLTSSAMWTDSRMVRDCSARPRWMA